MNTKYHSCLPMTKNVNYVSSMCVSSCVPNVSSRRWGRLSRKAPPPPASRRQGDGLSYSIGTLFGSLVVCAPASGYKHLPSLLPVPPKIFFRNFAQVQEKIKKPFKKPKKPKNQNFSERWQGGAWGPPAISPIIFGFFGFYNGFLTFLGT